MKTAILVLMLIVLLSVGSEATLAQSADKKEAISKVKLSEGALPLDMSIAREIWASQQELIRVRLRIGFPINALLNQTIIYVNQQAQVNYILPVNPDWLRFGYTRLIISDGYRSLIVLKDGVIVQIAATTTELQELVARALQADPVHYCKIRTNRLPEGWSILNEEYVPGGNTTELESNLSGKIQTALVQEFIIKRFQIKVKYYHCDTDHTAQELAGFLANRNIPIIKMLVESSGPMVASAESQDGELNGMAMTLVNLGAYDAVQSSE